MDAASIILIISLIAVTVVIVVAGIYLIGILKDVKEVTSLVTVASNLFSVGGKFLTKFLESLPSIKSNSQPKKIKKQV